jgi:hypothetical protein
LPHLVEAKSEGSEIIRQSAPTGCRPCSVRLPAPIAGDDSRMTEQPNINDDDISTTGPNDAPTDDNENLDGPGDGPQDSGDEPTDDDENLDGPGEGAEDSGDA